MRLSDLTGKEVINIGDGARLGYIDECELVFDGSSGRISALVLPKRGWMASLIGERHVMTIPWQNIRRIGEEVVIVDMDNAYDRMYSIYNHGDAG